MSQRSTELTEALSAFINQQPFFAVLLFDLLDVVEGEQVERAATDGKRVFVNPKYFKKLSVPERVFVLAHEVLHVILQHPARGKLYKDMGYGPDLKPYSHKKMNHAADYVINSYLNDLKVGRQPLGTLLNGQYGKDDLVDDVYCKLPDEEEDQDDGWDNHMDPAQDGTAPTKAEIQRALKMGETAQKMQGKMPAGLQRLIDDICEPQVSWQEHLEKTLITMHGSEEASWAKANRRRLAMPPHIPWPGRVGNHAGKIAVEIDTSGSIGEKELRVFLGELSGMLTDVRPELIYVMYVDAALFNDEVLEIDDPSDLVELGKKAGGGGGTDMTVVFREIENRQLDVEYVVVLTDGYTGFGEDVGVPTVWCITTPDITAPWGVTVHVKL